MSSIPTGPTAAWCGRSLLLPAYALGAFLVSGATWAPAARAQVADQVILYSEEPGTGAELVHRFDRKLALLGTTDVGSEVVSLSWKTPIATDGVGRYWITAGPLFGTNLVRLTSEGNLLPSAVIGHNPVSIAASVPGTIFALTRIPLLPPGPMYAVAGDGSVLWSNGDGPQDYLLKYPEGLAVTTSGEVWIGDSTFGVPGVSELAPMMLQIDPTTGAVLKTFYPPAIGSPGNQTFFAQLAAAPDGTMWTMVECCAAETVLVLTDGNAVLRVFPITGGYNGSTNQLRVDAQGDLWTVSRYTEEGEYGSKLLHFSKADGALVASYSHGGPIRGFAFGATGEEVYVVFVVEVSPFPRRLVRLNTVTGVTSSIALEPPLPSKDSVITQGDPTGFIYANVVDQNGDNDGDGHGNRAETLTGSSPFDAQSRPDGPKVYIDFTASNAIILIFKDPDGLLDPVGGLDVGSISLTAGPYGEIFAFLLPFLTFVQFSPDLTEATVVFGALPLASNLKWELEATVADLTGAVGWDWQVTPPGEL